MEYIVAAQLLLVCVFLIMLKMRSMAGRPVLILMINRIAGAALASARCARWWWMDYRENVRQLDAQVPCVWVGIRRHEAEEEKELA